MFKKKKVLFLMTVAIVVILSIVTSMGRRTEVSIYPLEKTDFQKLIELRGKVDLEEKETIYAENAGTIKAINGVEGQQVNPGDMLASFDISDIDIQMEKAKALYDSAVAGLEKVRKSVKPEEISQAQAQVEQAKIAYEQAKKDYEYNNQKYIKNKELLDAGAISQQDFNDIEMLLVSAKNSYNNAIQQQEIAKNNLAILKKGATINDIKEAQANVKTTRLQIKELENSKNKMILKSKMAGIILKKYIDEGSAIQIGSSAFDIGDLKSAYIKVEVLSDDITTVKIGQKALISGDILGEKEVEGYVKYIAPRAESSLSSLGVEQQRVEVKISFDNTKLLFKPGYSVDVNLVVEEKEETIAVPEKAIFDIDGKKFVFVVQGGVLKLTNIEEGLKNDDYTEIIKGVQAGEKVVVDPPSTVKEGQMVKETKYEE